MLEQVKEMLYLGIKMQRNGDQTDHIRERMKRANVVMKQVWGVGERKFQTDFKRRMMLFDDLIVGVILYEVGWKERIKCERIQQKYMRWCLGLERFTPGYMIIQETRSRSEQGREKPIMKKNNKCNGYKHSKGMLEKEATETRNTQKRREYLMRNGYSQAENGM